MVRSSALSSQTAALVWKHQGGLIPLQAFLDSRDLEGKSRACTMIQATRPRRRGGASNMQPVGDERVKSTGRASQLGFRRLLPAALFGRVDSKGHSRFVLRILIILSHPEPQTVRGSSLLFERGRAVKALPYNRACHKQRGSPASSLNAPVATVGAFPIVGFWCDNKRKRYPA